MNMLRDQVLEKIKREEIRPVASGYFVLRRWIGWGLVVALLVFSTLATAFAVHIVLEIDWEAFRHTEVSGVRAVLMSIPFLWLLLTIGFLLVASVIMRKTGRGYRYPLGILLLVFPLISTATGFSIEHSRFDEPIEKFFLGDLSQPEPWQRLLPSAEQQWAQPENGLLGGAVIEVDAEQETLMLEDREKKEWEVDFREAAIESNIDLQPNTQVNMIGTETGPSEFEAVVIKQPKSHRENKEQGNESYEQREQEESEASVQRESKREEKELHEEDEEDHDEEEEEEDDRDQEYEHEDEE